MFLKSLVLENFRAFERLELQFGQPGAPARPWTVLLGENGTGKSTVLKAIALLTVGSNGLADLIDQPESWIRAGAGSCRLSGVLETAQREARNVSLVIERKRDRLQVLRDNEEGLKPLDSALMFSSRSYFVAGYGAFRRLSPAELSSNGGSGIKDLRARSLASLFDPDIPLNPLESWAMDLDYRKDQGLDVVRDVLKDLLPGFQFSHIDKESKQLLFETADGLLPLKSLSEGFQSMAAWIGDLLFRISVAFSNYDSPLSARGLLLLDELDLHLHPRLQRRLLETLRSRLPNFQVVATTHSPLTAQQARPGELFYLERGSNGVSLREFAGDPRVLLPSQLLMSDAFGLDSDESAKVEHMKSRYRELKDRERSPQEESEFTGLISELSLLPQTGRPNVQASIEQQELLREIQAGLERRG